MHANDLRGGRSMSGSARLSRWKVLLADSNGLFLRPVGTDIYVPTDPA